MKYQVKYKDQIEKFNATRYLSFGNFVQSCIDNNLDCQYFIDGNEVSCDDALNEANKKYKDWFDRKNETHKKIHVPTGATRLKNTYQTIWVRK